MSRYDKLKQFLKNAKFTDVDMTFDDIEKVLGRALPPSAQKHRAWWSNNPDNNVMTKAWLEAGYQTVDVDMGAGTVTFEYAGVPQSQAPQTQRAAGFAEMPTTGFVHEGLFAVASKNLSRRAREWLDMESGDLGDKERLVVNAIESMAAKSLRRSIIEKYAKLKIGTGSDSVALIREARDER
jgi:hypothetical protein